MITNNNFIAPENSIGFGTNGIEDQEVFKMAIESGYRLFDAADLYGNSDLLSEAIKQSGVPRSDFVINYKILPDSGKEAFLAHVDEAIDKFGYIDTLMLHDMLADEEELVAILQLIREKIKTGAIKSIGLSNVNIELLKDLLAQFPEIKTVQNKFNHVYQDEKVREFCSSQGIDYMGYGIFGGRDEGACTYVYNFYNAAWNLSPMTFPELHNLAQKYETTPHLMLLAWAILQGTIQIPGSTKKSNMDANLKAKELAGRMSPEDKDKLRAELRSQMSAEEWKEIIANANQGDRLARLKKYLGNDLSRHRLIEKVYDENILKSFYDVLFDYNKPVEMDPPNEIAIARWIDGDRSRYVNMLTHFLEESLKRGEAEFQKTVNLFNKICSNCKTDAEKMLLLDLVIELGADISFERRFESLDKYIKEQAFLMEKGSFQVEEIQNSNKSDLPYNSLLSIGIIGPNKKIYLLTKLPTSTTLKEVSNILMEKFPDDFRNVTPSFFISHSDITVVGDEDLSNTTLKNLSLWDNDFIEMGTKVNGMGKQLGGFFHKIATCPKAYTAPYQESPPQPDNSKLGKSS